MKRIALLLLALGLPGVVAAYSFQVKTLPPPPQAELSIVAEAKNPWTSLRINNDLDEFQFAIVSDRTGGHRANIFSQAVERLNLMQPEFVLSVGDLIEGGRKSAAQLDAEWKELESYVNKLQMPFFYVPGNHDVSNKATDEAWGARRGRRHYHFIYHNVLFLILNTEDTNGAGGAHVNQEQIAYARDVLQKNRNVRWTIVALHKPVWTGNVEQNGWGAVEQALGDRQYTVFCGHVHRFHKFVRNGRNYYQLATTGGGSKMRGIEYGEFDHFVWVTMKKDGPLFANVLLDAVLQEDLGRPETAEPGVSTASRKPTLIVRGRAYYEGAPIAGAYLTFNPIENQGVRADAMVDADGSFTLSTYKANDGAVQGKYAVTATWRKPFYDQTGKPGKNYLPARFATVQATPLRVEIQRATTDLMLDLK